MRSRSSKLILVSLLALTVLLLPVGPLRRPADDARFSAADCARLQRGMTRADVVALLGATPGDYRALPPPDEALDLQFWSMIQQMRSELYDIGWTMELWCNDEVTLVVEFDYGGIVRRHAQYRALSAPAGFFEVLRWRTKRAWHRLFAVDPEPHSGAVVNLE
jgi:hypothetical protein